MEIIDKTIQQKKPSFSVLSLGFRPFFFAAGLCAVLLILAWTFIYSGKLELVTALPPMLWHGHEMVFGYCLAVIAGFLLTATKNWTSIQTLHGMPLLGLVGFWVAARVSAFIDSPAALWAMAVFDLAFMAGLLLSVLIPILRAKNRQQIPVVIKLGMMMLSNGLFYLGVLMPGADHLSTMGLYLGFYLILSLILMMGRRVIPFFIEGASPTPISLTNWKWLDLSSMFIFLAFMIVEIFMQQPLVSAFLAGALFMLHFLRLINWFHPSIFKRSLLWSLYIGYAFIVLGFAMKALSFWFALSPCLSLHAFAVGGIGLITTSMMARVALGHIGRNIMQPSPWLGWLFLLIAASAVTRALLPLAIPTAYASLVVISQVLWILAFALFVIIYAPILFKPKANSLKP